MKRSKVKKCINLRKVCLYAMSISKTAAMVTICLTAGSRFRNLSKQEKMKNMIKVSTLAYRQCGPEFYQKRNICVQEILKIDGDRMISLKFICCKIDRNDMIKLVSRTLEKLFRGFNSIQLAITWLFLAPQRHQLDATRLTVWISLRPRSPKPSIHVRILQQNNDKCINCKMYAVFFFSCIFCSINTRNTYYVWYEFIS